MDLDEATMERLVFIKALHRTAVEQSQKPQPMAAMSVLTFHDAVEAFLHLTAEEVGADTSSSIMKYWEFIPEESDTEPSHKSGIDRLRDSRNTLKHSANRPDELEIEAFRSTVQEFFKENTRKFFGIEFSDISLARLVKFEDTQEYLIDAEQLYEDAKLSEAMGHISMAHHVLFEEYEERAKFELNYAPFHDYYIRQSELPDDADNAIETMAKAINEFSKMLKYLCLGIDYRRYSKFEHLTPRLIHNHEENKFGKYRPSIKSYDESLVNDSAFNFCFQFVIEISLSLQESEFSYSEDPTPQADDIWSSW